MADDLDAVFAALADPTRRQIIARLRSGSATVNEVAEPFPISLQAVSKHLSVLEAAGLVARERSGRSRPCRLRPEALAAADAWLERYRSFWEGSFDALDEHLAEHRLAPEIDRRAPRRKGRPT